ncbi:hypothetical protein V2J09_013715 [Rumex salicifolius]
MNSQSPPARHTCLKLEVSAASDPQQSESIFVKGLWFESHFSLSITDGRNAWLCNASEEDVRERASQWDQPPSEYVEFAERYLGFQQPGSVYSFSDANNGFRRLSWTFEKEGIKLEWRWRCKPSPDSKNTTAEVLDFLTDANTQLRGEVVRKTTAFDKLKDEAEKCVAQSERISREKEEFETAVYAKFVSVLNSKKAKLREFRDKLANQESTDNLQNEDESTDKTETFDMSGSENGSDKDVGTSKVAPQSKGRGRKRRSVRN